MILGFHGNVPALQIGGGGSYWVMGNQKCINEEIEVPDICYNVDFTQAPTPKPTPKPTLKPTRRGNWWWWWSRPTPKPTSEPECPDRSAPSLFGCHSLCDDVDNTEWQVKLVALVYDAVNELTNFTYLVTVAS